MFASKEIRDYVQGLRRDYMEEFHRQPACQVGREEEDEIFVDDHEGTPWGQFARDKRDIAECEEREADCVRDDPALAAFQELPESEIDELREKPRLTPLEYRKVVSYFKDKCSQCGETFLQALDFHHRNPKDKLFTISQFYGLQREFRRTVTELFEEIQKCDVLCATCHRKETFDGRRP